MTSAALMSPMNTTLTTPQIEPANFLNLLIVDDERSIREACREVALSLGFTTFVADSAEHAYRLLDSQTFDAVLLDLRLPGAGGLDALRRIKERRPEAVVIVVTGYGTVQSAVQAMKNGAYDYVTKPFSVDELKLLLERVASHLKLKSENRMLREKVKSKQGFGGIVGRSPEMEKLYRIISKAANSVHPVLILGESGTGKEMVARSIHYSGPFRDKPFIPVDCGSLVPTLIESELFGYVRGGLHRRQSGQGRTACHRRRWHRVSRRSWRVAGRPAGQAPAGDSGKGDSPGRQYAPHPDQRPHPCRYQPNSGAGRDRRLVPPRPVFPSQR